MAVYIPEANRQPHLFLSHSSTDKDFVRRLAHDLAVFEIDVWLDEWEIGPGDSIYKAINTGIQTSKYVALIISKAFLESKWASEEVEAAFTKQIEQNSKVILPLLLEKVELPSLLKGKLFISFIEDYYSALTRLAGVIHGIELKTMSQALIKMHPQSLKESVDTLAYCGLDPSMIIPKDVFSELTEIDSVEVDGNRLRFPDLSSVYRSNKVSKRTQFYLDRVWTGNEKQHRWIH